MPVRSRRSLWTAKVLGQLPNRATSDEDAILAMHGHLGRTAFQGIILGVDPSLRGTGLALVEFGPGGARLLFSQTVKTKPTMPFATCLGVVFSAVQEALLKENVRHVAMEKTIFAQSKQVVHILGSARGAAMAAAGVSGQEVFEYAPLRVKQAVVGFGRASKEQVARTVAQHLNLAEPLPSDEADAAATALCHAFTWRG